ncbi:sugar nucleotide-binding protein [Methylobacterium sp. CB376]|uniref:sugar nucleotide-binding protein n=1 Tax=Methylobacterium sp. (strain 4-46) TaxID=426117 RepID=UPI00223FA889|nr:MULTISPECIES: sugar nucleotide-binding protein [Methylobacterium]WFT81680.1 sugar nucleotide-binding protein [Methylobacterium nodulans]
MVTSCRCAEAISTRMKAHGARSVPVEPITTSSYPTPARRPANSELSTATLSRDFGIVPRPWEAALADILDRLIGPVTPA